MKEIVAFWHDLWSKLRICNNMVKLELPKDIIIHDNLLTTVKSGHQTEMEILDSTVRPGYKYRLCCV